MELPVCRWRGGNIGPDHYECHSPKLVVGPGGVTGDICRGCPYADHAPENKDQNRVADLLARINKTTGGKAEAVTKRRGCNCGK